LFKIIKRLNLFLIFSVGVGWCVVFRWWGGGGGGGGMKTYNAKIGRLTWL